MGELSELSTTDIISHSSQLMTAADLPWMAPCSRSAAGFAAWSTCYGRWDSGGLQRELLGSTGSNSLQAPSRPRLLDSGNWAIEHSLRMVWRWFDDVWWFLMDFDGLKLKGDPLPHWSRASRIQAAAAQLSSKVGVANSPFNMALWNVVKKGNLDVFWPEDSWNNSCSGSSLYVRMSHVPLRSSILRNHLQCNMCTHRIACSGLLHDSISGAVEEGKVSVACSDKTRAAHRGTVSKTRGGVTFVSDW